MATTQEKLLRLLTLVSFSIFLDQHSCNAGLLAPCNFDAIYQFGDSLSDTGNAAIKDPNGTCNHSPYGKSFSTTPTGRCSDGLLMIDYIAEAAGLSFLEPYLKNETADRSGVDFAFGGATALPPSLLQKRNISTLGVTSVSLSDQLDWFSRHLNGTTFGKDRLQKLKRTLFIMGEIGLNDYNSAQLASRKSVEEIKKLIPEVIRTIKDAVIRVIRYGAATVVVPGQFPMGCIPIYLAFLRTNDTAAYDEFKCLKSLNSISTSHNDQLKQVIQELKNEYTNVTIVYGDYYQAFTWLLLNANKLGFDSVDKACCSVGGNGGFNPKSACGAPNVPVCPNPNKRISWDDIHLAQQANKYITEQLIQYILPDLDCTASNWFKYFVEWVVQSLYNVIIGIKPK